MYEHFDERYLTRLIVCATEEKLVAIDQVELSVGGDTFGAPRVITSRAAGSRWSVLRWVP
jgi:hypothetical protein